MNRNCMWVLLFSLLFAGCASIDHKKDGEVIQREFDKFSSWVEKNANYDPYGNSLVIEPKEFQERFNMMVKNINMLTSVKYEPISTYKGHCESYHDDWRCQKIRTAIEKSGIGYQWKKNALGRYINSGYVVAQRNVPQGNMNFGSYSVPINLTVGFIGGSSVAGKYWMPYYYHNFTIKKNVNAKAQPVSSPAKSADTGKGDIAERLKKLQQLKKQGLINDKEFDQKKKQLLESL